MKRAPTRDLEKRPPTSFPDGTQSVRRAAMLLRILASAHGLRLSEIGQASGLSLPTIRRFLKAMMEDGLVEQDAESRRYSIGEELSMLALARPFRLPLLAKADMHLRKLAQDVGDATFLTIQSRLDSLCVARYIGTYPIQVMTINVGARRPLGVSSAGLVILADMPTAKADDIMKRNSKRFPGYDVDIKAATRRLAQAREQQYSVNNTGLTVGTRTISVPLSGTKHTPSAAITVVAIHRRLTSDRFPEVVSLMQQAASRIAQTL
jgi:DNA-binding IclR family transcriptional regulator